MSRYLPNINKPKVPKQRGKARKHYTREDCLIAMQHTNSVKAAARYLCCTYQHLKPFFKNYIDEETGKSFFDLHKNQSGKGIPKYLSGVYSKNEFNIIDVVEGRVSSTHFNPKKLKARLIEEGILKEECYKCGFGERRLIDYKIPLILNFKDGVTHHYGRGNVEFLCYNCYFLYFADVLNEKDIEKLETHLSIDSTSPAIEFELDEYQLERMKELGLVKEPKKEDGDELDLISRI